MAVMVVVVVVAKVVVKSSSSYGDIKSFTATVRVKSSMSVTTENIKLTHQL